MILYLVRRHLGISADEWNSLPWWQAKVYLEGLEEEEIIKTSRPPEDLTNADLGSFAASGFKVRSAG